MMTSVSSRHECVFVNMQHHFPVSHLKLWSWQDSIHISSDHGIPTLLSVVEQQMSNLTMSKNKEILQRCAIVHLHYDRDYSLS